MSEVRRINFLLVICSDEENATNPKVTVDQDDFDFEGTPSTENATGNPVTILSSEQHNTLVSKADKDEESLNRYMRQTSISKEGSPEDESSVSHVSMLESNHSLQLSLDNDFPLWAGDTSARRSPEGTLFCKSILVFYFLTIPR